MEFAQNQLHATPPAGNTRRLPGGHHERTLEATCEGSRERVAPHIHTVVPQSNCSLQVSIAPHIPLHTAHTLSTGAMPHQ